MNTRHKRGIYLVDVLVIVAILGILVMITVFAIKEITRDDSEENSGQVWSIWHQRVAAPMPKIVDDGGASVAEVDLVQISCFIGGETSLYEGTDVYHLPTAKPGLNEFKQALSDAGITVYLWVTRNGDGKADMFIMNTSGIGFTLNSDEARAAINQAMEETKPCRK